MNHNVCHVDHKAVLSISLAFWALDILLGTIPGKWWHLFFSF